MATETSIASTDAGGDRSEQARPGSTQPGSTQPGSTRHEPAQADRGRPAAVITEVLGNVSDPAWATRLDGATVDLFELDQWAAQRSRIRRASQHGRDLAVSLDRGARLRDGDVLMWDETARRAVVARIHLDEVMVLDLTPVLDRPVEDVARSMLELGHALGNQHWPAVCRDNTVFVPVTVNRKVMASVMKTHAFEGIEPRFLAGTEVLPYMAPHEVRRLFGGADQGIHSHASGEGHDHHEHGPEADSVQHS